jgi:hypothetical protein
LSYDGTAIARIEGENNSMITGTFDGTLALSESASGKKLAECLASDHKIEFVR